MYTSKIDVFALGLILTQLCVVLTDDKAAEVLSFVVYARNLPSQVFYNYRAGRPNNVLNKHPQVVKLSTFQNLLQILFSEVTGRMAD